MIRISFIAIIAISAVSISSCKKEKISPPPPVSIPEDTVAIWTHLDPNMGSVYGQITDIEEKPGQIWISSFDHVSASTSKISVFNYLMNNQQIIDSTTTPLLNSKVTSIGFNSAGELHIGAQFYSTPSLSKEIIVRSGNVYTSYNSPGGTAYNFEDFYFNSEGLWYGSGNTGLVNFNNSVFTVYDSWNSGIPYPNYVLDFSEIDNQDFWFTSSNSLLRKTGNSFDVVESNVYPDAMDTDSQGNLWLAGYNGNFYFFDGTTLTQSQIPSPFSSNTHVTDLVCDSYDNIWIATSGAFGGIGLMRYNGSNWTHFDVSNSDLHSNNLTKLKVDNVGNLWIGSEESGVMRLNKFGTNN